MKLMFHLLLFIVVTVCGRPLTAQNWNFVKEKNGIKMFTANQGESSFKCFRGETVFHARLEQLDQYIGVASNFDQWDENISELKVLHSQPGRHIQCYFVYITPWPLNNRDFYADVEVSFDTASQIKTVYAYPMAQNLPEESGIIRVKNYWLKWTLTVRDEQIIEGVIEGFIDPGGLVPSWLYNLVIVEAPYKVMKGIKQKVESLNDP
jgi:hypothetical protein